jgi:16S rRNA (uracil1498-N3)-methyltransferase
MRIFVAPALLAPGELVVRGDEHHYLSRVRRARTGDAVELVDGAGRRASAVIARISEAETLLQVAAPEAIVPRPPFVRALLPLIKGDRMDTCLEKLVEVGVDAIVVWPAARSVVRLEPDRREARLAKYAAALQAAARQSGRAHVPPITWAEDLRAAAAQATGLALVLDPTSDAPLPLAAVSSAADVTIVSGPEGGLAPAELDALSPFTPLGLGPRVLRAETAPVIAVALIRAATQS